MPSISQSAYQHAPQRAAPAFQHQSALQSGLQAQVTLLNELTRRSCDAMRHLSDLHLQFAQQAVQDATDAARLLLACSDPFQLALAAARGAQPASQHWQSYQQQLASMWSGVAAVPRSAAREPEQRYGGETLSPAPIPVTAPDPVSTRGDGAFHADAGVIFH